MFKNYSPVKTEYKGIVFDSKLEAIFAKALDESGVQWERCHPIEHCNHLWDFLVYAPATSVVITGNGERDIHGKLDSRGIKGCFLRKEEDPILIELKPSMPTETYVQNLRDNWEVYGESSPQKAAVVYGNPYEPPDDEFGYFKIEWVTTSRRLYQGCHFCWALDIPGKFDNEIKKARNFRFDLK